MRYLLIPGMMMAATIAAWQPIGAMHRALRADDAPTRCRVSGFLMSKSEDGVALHAGPSATSPVLGRLYPIVQPPADADVTYNGTYGDGADTFGMSVRIIDVASGWVEIDEPWAPEDAGDGRRNHDGRGWVPEASLGYLVGYGEEPAYAEPDPRSAVVDPYGARNMAFDAYEPVLLDCRGPWLRLKYRATIGDGVTPRERLPWTSGWIRDRSYRAEPGD